MPPFPFDIDQAIPGQISYKTVNAQFGDGYSQRSPDGVNNKVDTWTIKVPWLTTTQVTTMEAFLDSVGFHNPFLWKPPNLATQQKYIITGISIDSENTKCMYTLNIKRVYDVV